MLPKKVYEGINIYCVYINQTCGNNKKLMYYKCSSRFIMGLKIKNTQIVFIGHLIKFIWIIVLGSQVRHEMLVLGLDSHLP